MRTGQPIKHHFLPVFYLKRWAQTDGRLIEFSKPFGDEVKPKRVHPEGTGYISRLYAIQGLPDEVAHEMEREFLSPIDSRAADALKTMLDGGEFSTTQRLAWAGFIATLLSRMPSDIKTLHQTIMELFSTIAPGFENIFQALKPENEVRTFEQMTEELLASAAPRVINHAKSLMSNQRLLSGLAAMEWSVLTVDRAGNEFLTSDRPVIHTNVLGRTDSHLVVPIGPRRLFVAVSDRTLMEKIKSVGEDKLVSATNAAVVGAADKFVYGRSDSQLRFVQNRMGGTPVLSLIERMRVLQKSHSDDVLKTLRELAIPARNGLE
ncbi:hypothetical protein CK228_21405 [Mesorhizobium sp. WSM4312]|uniref:DUF4238 domain-containing protein n=1 Tax=Mesorhizobium sp. WSM4312 TaxID=2029411 RepID=UPI000BAF4FC6|nr:DUF4238 domain-containing protein [Mesorhizobium sp. WSM4312]PBB66591.1 hypothetical protein CK228_21405 [Mesorhizobium sp. WSM4312]